MSANPREVWPEKDFHPLVSVVMTVYNGENFLRDAIDSVLKQTYRNLELVVVDDGSTDETPRILEYYTDERMRILRNSFNLGVPKSVNRCLAETRGELIVRHDADDVSLPERFEQQVAFLKAHPSVGVVSTDYWLIDDKNRILDLVQLPGENLDLQEGLQSGNLFASGSVMIRREVWEGAGGFRGQFLASHDYDLWLRVAEITEMANLQTPLFRYRFHSSSISRTKRALQFAEKNLALSLAQDRRSGKPEKPIPSDILLEFPPDPRRLFLSFRHAVYLYYASDQYSLATEAIQNAIKIQPAAAQEETSQSWAEWALGKAHHLSGIRNHSRDGENFLRWLARSLKPFQVRFSALSLAGRYYADKAFLAYQNKERSMVSRYFRRAVRNDGRLLFNRGLWSILLKAGTPSSTGKKINKLSV